MERQTEKKCLNVVYIHFDNAEFVKFIRKMLLLKMLKIAGKIIMASKISTKIEHDDGGNSNELLVSKE